MQNKLNSPYIENYALQAYGLKRRNMKIPQKKPSVRIVKNGDIQLNFAGVQQHVKYVQKNTLHIFIIAMSTKQRAKNVLILY